MADSLNSPIAEKPARFKAAKLEEDPNATQDDLDRAGAKAFNAPTLLVILIDPVQGHAKVTVDEQFIALGAALQNFILTAHSLGYGAMITSGDKVPYACASLLLCKGRKRASGGLHFDWHTSASELDANFS